MSIKVQIWKVVGGEEKGQHRFRVKNAENNETMETGEAYKNPSDMISSIKQLHGEAVPIVIIDDPYHTGE